MSADVRMTAGGAFEAIATMGVGAAQAAVDAVAAKGHQLISQHLREGVDSAGHRGREDTGAAGQALHHEPARIEGTHVVASVDVQPPADEYWNVIEGGREPGHGVNAAGQAKIDRWADRKLGRSASDSLIRGLTQRVSSRRQARHVGGKLRRVTAKDRERAKRALVFLITRKIREKGIPGIAPFATAARQLREGEAQRVALAAVQDFARSQP